MVQQVLGFLPRCSRHFSERWKPINLLEFHRHFWTFHFKSCPPGSLVRISPASCQKRHLLQQPFSTPKLNHLVTLFEKNIHSKSRNDSITYAAPELKTTTLDSSSKIDSSEAYSQVLDRYIYLKSESEVSPKKKEVVVLDIAYADSHPNEDFDPKKPLVLALHDTPGCHDDLKPLLNFFAKLGCRTVCPTFPGHGNSQGLTVSSSSNNIRYYMQAYDEKINQKNPERVAFVHEFVKNIGIERVDVLIGVGASSYTATALCSMSPKEYRSLALLSPWPASPTRYKIGYAWTKILRTKLNLTYFRPFVNFFIRLVASALSIGPARTLDDKMALWNLLAQHDSGEAESFVMVIALKNIPRLVAYGAKDNLVSEEVYRTLTSKLGIPGDQVTSDLRLALKAAKSHPSGALVFPDSGYDILNQHHSALCAYILRLVQKSHPQIKI